MHNNLMRVKGILSARQGTQVPKFNSGGTTYQKHLQNGTTLYSKNGWQWFSDSEYTNAYIDVNSPEFLIADTQEIPDIIEESAFTKVSPNLYGNYENNSNTVTIPGEHPSAGKPNYVIETGSQIVNTANSNAARQRELTRREINQYNRDVIQENTGLTNKQQERIKAIRRRGNDDRADRVENRLKNRNANREQNLNDAEQIMRESINGIGNTFQAYNSINNSNETNTIDTGVDVGSKLLTSIGDKVGGKTGAIMGAIGQVIGMTDSTGQIIRGITGGTDQMTAADKFFDSGIGTVLGGFVNQIWSEKSNAFATDVEALETVGSSYGGTAADITEAAQKADKKYGLFSSSARRKTNEAAKKVAATQNIMSGIADTARDQRLAVQSMGEQAGLAYSIMTDGGYNQKYTYAAKHGGLLEWNPVIELEWEPQVELNWELPTFKEGGSIDFVEELEWIPEFKSGGKTEETDVPEIEETTQKNVIPEGALHKNKHHMEHAEGLTKKGIPVVDEDGEQQAEIEHSEIIFTLEVTKKLEEYYEIFYSEESTNKEKEQAALDAGKLLVYQILENTEDRTGLIESFKKGGSLTLKKSTDDIIEEVLEWMPTVVIVETEEPKKESKKEESEVSKKDTKDEIKEMIREVLIELLVK